MVAGVVPCSITYKARRRRGCANWVRGEPPTPPLDNVHLNGGNRHSWYNGGCQLSDMCSNTHLNLCGLVCCLVCSVPSARHVGRAPLNRKPISRVAWKSCVAPIVRDSKGRLVKNMGPRFQLLATPPSPTHRVCRDESGRRDSDGRQRSMATRWRGTGKRAGAGGWPKPVSRVSAFRLDTTLQQCGRLDKLSRTDEEWNSTEAYGARRLGRH